MIINRIGNKKSIAALIWPHFPEHSLYIEMFFGAGGMFFNKPQCSRNILNDVDGDVVNLFLVVKDRFDEFLFLFKAMPMHEDLFYDMLQNKETDPVRKALRFLYLSNFSYMGKSDTFLLLQSECTHKKRLESLILTCAQALETSLFRNKDFRVFLDGIQVSDVYVPKRDRFIYADPPYHGTTHNYSEGFKEQDTIDLFETLVNSGIRFALSELNTPFVMDLAESHGLTPVWIKENYSMQKKRVEMLYINYELHQTRLF